MAGLEAEIAKFKSESWFRNKLFSEKLTPYDAELPAYITFDPAPIWEKISVPFCSLWGEKGTAVPAEKSKISMETALKKEKTKTICSNISSIGTWEQHHSGKNEVWDFPRLSLGYQETRISRVRKIKLEVSSNEKK